ncbi:MAG TPA: haloacid dehalogenase [Anaerolineae bacterium]|nr:haloacid dehalogenase [Anaerolineae bacterium]
MNDTFTEIADKCHQCFEALHNARENALKQARLLTRLSAHAIRAVHRKENKLVQKLLKEAREITEQLKKDLKLYPSLYYSGYTQDAIKEYAEAQLTYHLIEDLPLPMPEQLGIEHATYLRGLAETIGELRRKCLDILRHGYSQDAERLLSLMDEIYSLLVTMDFPDAITRGLRRQTDLVRGMIERTRADLTLSLREERLQKSLRSLEEQLPPKS